MKRALKPLLFILSIALFNCDGDDEISTADLKKQAIENYADIVYANYDDSYKATETLKNKISEFVSNPTQSGFEACKTAWLAARTPYGQSEVFRFYGGPIDDEDGPEGFINAWPIDENYIDYTVSQPTNGIINDTETYPTIDKTLLASLNEAGSETNISTGYHAIEFLLWGQDLSTSGPGARPYTDYVSGDNSTASNQQRRGAYLLAAANLLLEQIGQVRDEWVEGASYRTSFTSQSNTTTTLGYIFDGMGILSKGELAGERMLVAAESKDQENEHSCFSDNTLADLKMNFQGIKNVYYGSYTRLDNSVVSGRSFKELSEKANKTKAAALETSFQEVEAKLNLIPAPFDQAIINDADKIVDAAQSLSLLSDRVADVLVDVKK
jgi:putative iron-regulated protein